MDLALPCEFHEKKIVSLHDRKLYLVADPNVMAPLDDIVSYPKQLLRECLPSETESIGLVGFFGVEIG